MPQIIFSLSSIAEVAGSIAVIATAYLKVRKIVHERKKQKEVEKAIILQEAKEIALKYKRELETKIELLQRDLDHVKETHSSEIKFVGERIQELRDEVRTQLSQIVMLVSKLIDRD